MSTVDMAAIAFLLPAVDPMLESVTRKYSHATRQGARAHITALYPFLEVADVDEDVVDWLRGFAATQVPRQLALADVSREAGYVFLPAEQLNVVIDPIRKQWPEIISYGGRFGEDPIAHVTIAMGPLPTRKLMTSPHGYEHSCR